MATFFENGHAARTWSMPHEFGKTLKLAAAAYPPEQIVLPILVVGDPGAGKSSIFKYFAKSASYLGHSGVLIDVKCELAHYARKHFATGSEIMEIDPFVVGGTGIDFAKAWKTQQECDGFSHKIVPSVKGDASPFFRDGARGVVRQIPPMLMANGAEDVRFTDVINVMYDRHLFSALAEQVPTTRDIFASMAGTDGARDLGGTLMSLAAKYETFAAANDSCEKLVSPYWALEGKNRWMVLTREATAAAAVGATHSFILDSIFEKSLTQRESEYVIIGADEFRSYERLEKIGEAVRLGRSPKCITFMTLHELNGLYDKYGPGLAKELLALCAFKVFLRTSGIETAEWISKCLGEPLCLRKISPSAFDEKRDTYSVQPVRNVTAEEIRHALPLASWENDEIRGYLEFPGLIAPFKLQYRKHVEVPPAEPRVPKPKEHMVLKPMTLERVKQLGFKITKKVETAIGEKEEKDAKKKTK